MLSIFIKLPFVIKISVLSILVTPKDRFCPSSFSLVHLHITGSWRLVAWGHKIIIIVTMIIKYSKTCLKRSHKKKTKLVFKTDCRLMRVKSIATCSKGSILQFF